MIDILAVSTMVMLGMAILVVPRGCSCDIVGCSHQKKGVRK